MRSLIHLVLGGGALLGLTGCISDFSPDALKQEPGAINRADSGAKDAGKKDATTSTGSDDNGGDDTDTGGEVDPDDGNDNDPPPSTGGDAGTDTPQGDAGGSTPSTGVAGPAACNMTGKWLVTERFGLTGLGAQQAVWNWYYAEIEHTSDTEIRYKKSLSCGAFVDGLGFIAVMMDDSQAWPAYTMNPAYEGRKGTVAKTADGCMISIEKDATVRGATVNTYRDLSKALPKLEEKATADKPGWEDWDEDGMPGVTLNISGFASGALYAVTRNWTAYAGPFKDKATLLTLALDWGQSRSTLGYTSSQLNSEAARDEDETRHTVELGKMTDAQTKGSDLDICKSVRDLAKTLTPNASIKK